MSKEAYFEACDSLGEEVVEDDIPMEFEDLHWESQQAFIVYNALCDNWDSMSGEYMGKIMSGIGELFDLYNIDDRQVVFKLIRKIDEQRKAYIKSKSKKPPTTT